MVFDVIRGADGLDPTIKDAPFNFKTTSDLSGMKIGYFKNLFENDYNNRGRDSTSLAVLRSLGANLEAVELPDNIPVGSISFILTAEAATAFDDLTRTNRDDLLVRQIKNAWPNVFRQGRFIPAVEYLQANRLRTQLIQDFHEMIKDYDVIVTPSFGGSQLLMTNLTGHPSIAVPNGFTDNGSPTSITFLGNLFDEASILAVANAYQEATDFDEQHPPLYVPE